MLFALNAEGTPSHAAVINIGHQATAQSAVSQGPTNPPSAATADFVDDNVVNGLDFLAWQTGFGTTTGALVGRWQQRPRWRR